MLHVNFLWLVSWKCNEKASAVLFWEYSTRFCMRKPKIFVQEIVFLVPATKEEEYRSGRPRSTLCCSFCYKCTKWRTSSSWSNENKRKWLWWGRKGTSIEPHRNINSCSQIKKVRRIAPNIKILILVLVGYLEGAVSKCLMFMLMFWNSLNIVLELGDYQW